jgi:cytochrome c
MTKKRMLLPAVAVLAFPFIHPFGPVRTQNSREILPGVQLEDARVRPILEKACQNCHSQRTEWPVYSYLPFASWALEKDVAEARQHMDLSRWDQYSLDEQQDLLARMGAEVRSHEMPLPRYLLLHHEARLSEEEISVLYNWTKAQRRILRSHPENTGE